MWADRMVACGRAEFAVWKLGDPLGGSGGEQEGQVAAAATFFRTTGDATTPIPRNPRNSRAMSAICLLSRPPEWFRGKGKMQACSSVCYYEWLPYKQTSLLRLCASALRQTESHLLPRNTRPASSHPTILTISRLAEPMLNGVELPTTPCRATALNTIIVNPRALPLSWMEIRGPTRDRRSMLAFPIS